MFNADYYELGAVLDRVSAQAHLANLPKCDDCGRECCTDYLRVEPYTECRFCGSHGNSAAMVNGRLLCDYCY